MRLIDGEATKVAMVETIARMMVSKRWMRSDKDNEDEILAVIDNAPTIDAVPVVHARWVHEQRYGDSGGWVWRCTACRHEAISPIISALKYCHSCGAKMDGGAES